MKLALWVVRCNRPFAIVEDTELVDIFRDLNNKVVTPSRYTVSHDVKEIFQMSRLRVAEILKAKIHFSSVLDVSHSCSRHVQENFIFVQMDGQPHMLSHSSV